MNGRKNIIQNFLTAVLLTVCAAALVIALIVVRENTQQLMFGT